MLVRETQDHPRVCGEQFWFDKNNQDVEGSPPRVRGTVPSLVTAGMQIGITPACAGNRSLDRIDGSKG